MIKSYISSKVNKHKKIRSQILPQKLSKLQPISLRKNITLYYKKNSQNSKTRAADPTGDNHLQSAAISLSPSPLFPFPIRPHNQKPRPTR
jgi:hypothetical protein